MAVQGVGGPDRVPSSTTLSREGALTPADRERLRSSAATVTTTELDALSQEIVGADGFEAGLVEISASGTVRGRDRSQEMQRYITGRDSQQNARAGMTHLRSMPDADFNATVRSMASSGSLTELIGRMNSRPMLNEFLRDVGARTPRSTREAVLSGVPILRVGPQNGLSLTWADHAPNLGARGPAAPAAARAVIGEGGEAFSGSGATGVLPSDAPMDLETMARLPLEADAARRRFGPNGLDHVRYTRTPGFDTLYDWSNPIKGNLTGPGSYLDGLSAEERTQQAQVLLNRPIATEFPENYPGGPPTRLQVIRAAARAHNIEPELLAGVILAEQRDQTGREDAVDFNGAVWGRNSSVGLGQVTIDTARNHNLFGDLLPPSMQREVNERDTSVTTLLSSDEFNIFATARYIRDVADRGARQEPATLPRTTAAYPGINLSTFAAHSSTWTDDHIRLLGSEYTSRPFDDRLRTGWGSFVFEAVSDVRGARLF